MRVPCGAAFTTPWARLAGSGDDITDVDSFLDNIFGGNASTTDTPEPGQGRDTEPDAEPDAGDTKTPNDPN